MDYQKRDLLARRGKKPRDAVYAFKPFKWEEEVPQTPLVGKLVPKERSGHRIVYYDGCLYSFGGYNPSVESSDPDLMGDPHWIHNRPLFKELWRFNIFSKKWKKLEMHGDIPDQLASHTAVMFNNKLLVYGGTGAPFGLTTSNSVYICDLRNLHWEEIDTTSENQFPTPLYGQAVVMQDGNFYTVGGTSGFHYYMDIHRLNLRTKAWELLYRHSGLETEPAKRYRHELCTYKNYLILLGGGTSFEANSLNNLPSFNIETKSWDWLTTKPDNTILVDESLAEQFPPARRCHGSIQIKNHVFIFGGYDGDEIFDDCWRLDLETMTWSKLPFSMPSPSYFHAGTVTDAGKIYSFGGVNNIEVNSRTNLVCSCWASIPSLRAMCWEALNSYVPDLDSHPVDKLLEEGIPRDLINTLHDGVMESVG